MANECSCQMIELKQMKMKNILLTIAVIIISYVLGHSQTPTVFNSILENTMNIADQKIENQQLSQKFVSIKTVKIFQLLFVALQMK